MGKGASRLRNLHVYANGVMSFSHDFYKMPQSRLNVSNLEWLWSFRKLVIFQIKHVFVIVLSQEML